MVNIQGRVDPAFAKVKEAFESNFGEQAEFSEVGAALCVYMNGVEVVSLWGGLADPESGKAWEEDTLAHVFSSTKGLPAIAMAQLVEQGKASYSDKIAKYWPEFAQHGKQDITIAQVLSHQSGVNAFDEPLDAKDMLDWALVCERLAAQTPAFEPGSVTAYHAVSYGHLVMEVVRRITGLMPADYVAEFIATPLNADISIGADEALWPRIATLIPPPPPKGGPQFDPRVLKALQNPLVIPGVTTSTPEWRHAQVPAVNGHVSAAGYAKLWGAIANKGSLNDEQILSEQAINIMATPLSDGPDMMMGPGQWAAGVSRNRGNMGPRDTTFGSFGFGGSFGIADPALGIGAAYVPNKLFPSILQDPRAKALTFAIMECAEAAK